jgi:hypothetical protein
MESLCPPSHPSCPERDCTGRGRWPGGRGANADRLRGGWARPRLRPVVRQHSCERRAEVRGSRIAPELWQRIAAENKADDVFGAGTVRLTGSELAGGVPAVVITGVRFDPKVNEVAVQHADTSSRRHSGKLKAEAAEREPATVAVEPAAPSRSAIRKAYGTQRRASRS